MVTILQCESPKQLKLFERTAEAIHRKEPYFVPPFPGSIVKLFSPKSPFHKHGRMFPMVALRDGKPVGRICAVVNGAHNAYYKDKVGFFGFFECVNEPEVAAQLFAAAQKKLQEQGAQSMRGPYNPTVNDECGLLVEGFEATPFVMMPYNPPYYLDLYKAAGMEPARDLYAFYLSSQAAVPERIGRIVERVKKSTGVTFRNLDLKNLKREIPILRKLYNETLDRNWGFVPLTDEDLEYAAGDLKAIMDPNMVIIAEKDGVPVGFSMAIPNINEVLWKAKDKQGILRILKFIWLMKTRPPREARLAILGVAPEYRNRGIAPVFYFEALIRGRRNYVGGELSWVEESNTEMAKAIALMGGEKYKTYRIYERAWGNA